VCTVVVVDGVGIVNCTVARVAPDQPVPVHAAKAAFRVDPNEPLAFGSMFPSDPVHDVPDAFQAVKVTAPDWVERLATMTCTAEVVSGRYGILTVVPFRVQDPALVPDARVATVFPLAVVAPVAPTVYACAAKAVLTEAVAEVRPR